jgi:hypothetical protein
MIDEKKESARAEDGEIDDSERRSFAMALFAAFGGAALLEGCANPDAQGDPNELGQVRSAATGSIAWFSSIFPDATGTLKGTSGTAGQLAVAQGYWTAGDGGGGLFWWDQASKPDNGGTSINPTGSVGGWRRIYSGPLNVKWFGAKGDNSNPDWQAIHNAIVALESRQVAQLPSGESPNTSQAIEFPEGIYLVSDVLEIDGQRTNVFSNERAIVRQTAMGKDVLSFTNAYGNTVRGLTFVDGVTQVRFQNGNLASTVLRIEDCEFHTSWGFAVAALPSGSADHLSAQLTIDNCKFSGCAAVLKTMGDINIVQNCFILTPSTPTPGETLATFLNGEGNLYLRGSLLDSAFNIANFPSVRWIDNHGSVLIDQCAFGGDGGTGMPIIYHSRSLPDDSVSGDYGSFVSICNSSMSVGDPAHNGAVMNVVSGFPIRFVFQGNLGPQGNETIIQILPNNGYDLAGHIQSHSSSRRIEISLDGNTGVPLPVEPVLVPYVNLAEANGFPIGSRPGVPDSMTSPQAHYDYNLPPNLQGFVALVTVSSSPTSGGMLYRLFSTYYVSLSTNFTPTPDHPTGEVVDVLSFSQTPLAQSPVTPAGFQPPVIDKVEFLSTHISSDPKMRSAGIKLGGIMRITWRTQYQAPIIAPQITFQPVHIMV